jgi:lipid II:glycine glycyltransferase (peptidoglycan interpeptide bridge formation enzyme)
MCELHATVEYGSDGSEWDSFLSATEGGHHAQSTMWAQVKSRVGWQASRIIVRRRSEIVGGVQLLTRSVARGVSVGFAPRGPLLPSSDPRALDVLHRALLDFGREQRIRYLKVQPSAASTDLVPALRRRGWTLSALEAAPTATVRVDLTPSQDEILGAMRQSTRRMVRQSMRRGLRMRIGGGDDLATYLEIVKATSRRQGFSPYPPQYYETIWRAFVPSDRACLMFAELDGHALSSTLLVGFGNTVTYKLGGWTGERTNVRPNEAIHFAGMCWAKERGYHYYDFDGIDKHVALELRRHGELPDAARRGVAHFKLGFGGQVQLMPGALDIAPSLLLRPAVRMIAPRVDRYRSLAHKALGRR